jgi:hypothetical protein
MHSIQQKSLCSKLGLIFTDLHFGTRERYVSCVNFNSTTIHLRVNLRPVSLDETRRQKRMH